MSFEKNPMQDVAAKCSSAEERFSTTSTQTPLTLTRLTIENQSFPRKSERSNTDLKMIGASEISYPNDGPPINHGSSYHTETHENHIATFPACQSNTIKMSVLLNEAATQATPLHPSLVPVKRSASDTSSKSGSKSEIFTLITEYDDQSPNIQTTQGNLDLSHTQSLTLPSSSSGSSMRINVSTHHDEPHSRLRLSGCLRCIPSLTDETDSYSLRRGAPPTYSSIYADRAANSRRTFFSANQSSFVAPIPPPSYAQTQGISLATYSADHLFPAENHRLWSPHPTAAICPRCTAIIITEIEVRRSMFTWFVTFMPFLCCCWTCCVIPNCTNLCKTTDHYCPICQTYLGTYTPL